MKRALVMFGVVAAMAIPTVGAFGAGVAAAASNANGTTLYTNNAWCGGALDLTQPTDGFVNFHVTGNTVTLNYHVKGGLPDATVYVDGYDSACNFDAFLGTLTTNSNGVGNATFTYTVPAGFTSVWTFADEVNASGIQTSESHSATP